ncbi:AAA family ATPase [Variovorax sp.]|jgi:predicted kinase|uniref:AAA family ATPase n=1 Tax=Variovorax sp. TaxID=1871043 RepID=UPI0037D9A125
MTSSFSATLIVLAGLPGVGKTQVARAIVAQRPAVFLRIDAIEQAIAAARTQHGGSVGIEGYAVAYALARANLALGQTVVADSVNPLEVTRAAWREVARSTGAASIEVELVCTDLVEHRRRVETRASDLPGLVPPTWASVQAHDYAPWSTPRLVIDTARVSSEEAARRILAACALPISGS